MQGTQRYAPRKSPDIELNINEFNDIQLRILHLGRADIIENFVSLTKFRHLNIP